MKPYLISIIILLIVIVGGFIIYQKFGQLAVKEEFAGARTVQPTENAKEAPVINGVPDFSEVGPVADAIQREKSITISYTDSGFVPAEIKVRTGAVINFINNSSRPMWVASDPHPIHGDLRGFDQLQGVGQQGSYSFTFIKAGNWEYHNHLGPRDRGMVIVE